MDNDINVHVFGPYFDEINEILRKHPYPHDREAQMDVLKNFSILFENVSHSKYTIYICMNEYMIQNCYELLHQNSRLRDICRNKALQNAEDLPIPEVKDNCRRLIEFIDSIGDIFDTKEPDCF
jgi:hypothetical protein